MFESLSDKLQDVFKRLGSKGRLTEADVDEAMGEVRRALLAADVNYKVVKSFMARLRERAIGGDVLESLTPAQQVIKLVNEALIDILGGSRTDILLAAQPPTIVMLVGLQGSGKTTTAAKLGLHLRKGRQGVLLVAADTRRPAAVNQLVTLGQQLNVPVYEEGTQPNPVDICARGVQKAREMEAAYVILDTQGRLHIDDDLMHELEAIRDRVRPSEIMLVADAMTGQDAVRAAEEFHGRVGLTGLILTKMDGDARGGAALSIKSVTGVPIKFIGTGEKADALEPFHPDRVASRILGMGDVLSLIEKAQTNVDQQQAKAMEKKLREATFDLEDFLSQLQQIKSMGPLSQILEMVPGFSGLRKQLPAEAMDDGQLKRIEAIIYSMTPAERHNPHLVDGSRRKRIARGSGTTPQEINQLLNQFFQMRKMMKDLSRGRMPGIMGMFR